MILNESDIHSGDFFGVIRLDGLDPMLAFGMGSHTGHTALALWEDIGMRAGVCPKLDIFHVAQSSSGMELHDLNMFSHVFLYIFIVRTESSTWLRARPKAPTGA